MVEILQCYRVIGLEAVEAEAIKAAEGCVMDMKRDREQRVKLRKTDTLHKQNQFIMGIEWHCCFPYIQVVYSNFDLLINIHVSLPNTK